MSKVQHRRRSPYVIVIKEAEMKAHVIARIYLGLGFAILALVTSCGGLPGAAPAALAPSEIKVGAVVPLTGRYAAGGDQVNNGYLLAVDDINKAGGVDFNGTK